MARLFAFAPSIAFRPLQTVGATLIVRLIAAIERRLERERDQLALWLPVGLGLGIAAWFALPDDAAWIAFLLAMAALLLAGIAMLPRGTRLGRSIACFALAALIGMAAIWTKAERVAAPRIERPAVARFTAKIEAVNRLAARAMVRLSLAPLAAPGVPPRIRLNVREEDAPAGLEPGALVAVRARLMPPAPPAVPGAYDFARVAWFQGIGAVGRALEPVRIIAPASTGGALRWIGGLRARLSAHIQGRLDRSAGGIATALVTGDQGALPEEDAEAMRRSGLAHLLSVSGLHVTAVVAAVMLIVLRLLALSPRLALHAPLPLIAAGAAALAGVGYTLLAGAEVPTIRSCIAALLVLGGLALGREAITLRLVAAGALVVLLLWPEALAGPSFQLSSPSPAGCGWRCGGRAFVAPASYRSPPPRSGHGRRRRPICS